MLDVARRQNSDMYTHRFSNNALIMSLGALAKPALPAMSPSNRLLSLPPPVSQHRPIVKASTMLSQDSFTEIIDVDSLMTDEAPGPLVQYVEIAEAAGKLYCVDNQIKAECWLKIITIAKDCQSSNVLLMTDEKGVFLKTIRPIVSGETLLLWFTQNILAMLNMPYLTSVNIETCYNRYVCHVCQLQFDYPNNLKIHLALDCNRLDSNHLWRQLGKEFNRVPLPMLSLDVFQKPPPPFSFTLTGLPSQPPSPASVSPPAHASTPSRTLTPARISPIALEGTFNISTQALLSGSSTLSPSLSTSTSPNSSTQTSPKSPGQMSYCSSASSNAPLSPVKRNIGQRHSAFKPYSMHKPTVVPSSVTPPALKPIMPAYHLLTVVTPPPPPPPPVALMPMGPGPVQPDAHAAHMETVASNLGKSKAGHQCIYCGKIYSRKYGLKIHIRTHTGYKPLKCKFCLRPFGDPSNLNKHVRLHADGDTPYRCHLCDKVLVRRRDLERHIRSRHRNDGSPETRDTDGTTDTTTDEDMDDAPEL
ncbi:sal-like protein 3 [Nasonia vitripennis]|uniref:C2H2-type domain-containing protein n=1 Tax=Nasonia vitripennis TaxID=7425 RepID=A0A7M7G616_NASVI|nr:sal-like protein 3 [Nasonia vitripennis]